MIAIRNLARTAFTVNLDLAHDYEGHPECASHRVRMALPATTPTGEDGVRHYERECPGSITWLAGEEKALPDAVATLPPVRLRLGQKLMRLAPVPEPKPEPELAVEAPAPHIVSPDDGA